NYEVVQRELEGTDGHYFQQVRAMSLVQCIVSTDFIFLYIAFVANVVPLLMFVPQVSDMARKVWLLSNDELNAMLLKAYGANILGRFTAPLVSDGLMRLLYANPAFMRKAVFQSLLAIQFLALALIGHSITDARRIQWLACALTFCSGGGLAVMPCFITDMFGVYHSGTMYGLILTGYSLGGVVVGYTSAAVDISYATLERQVNLLAILVTVGCVLMFLVRTNSMDRFFLGYQYSVCGKILVQVPFYNPNIVRDTCIDDGVPVLTSTTTHPAEFSLWDRDLDGAMYGI
ncbi:hypothetical protein As57867_006996, partial [Aphanomyces stellatus]